MTEIEEMFPYDNQRKSIDALLDAKRMFSEDFVAPYIKDFVMAFEKRLLKQLHSGKMSTEDLVSMFISLFAYFIHEVKETDRPISMSKETLDTFYLIMEHYNPKLIDPVTQEDYGYQLNEFDRILELIIDEKAKSLGLDDEETKAGYYFYGL